MTEIEIAFLFFAYKTTTYQTENDRFCGPECVRNGGGTASKPPLVGTTVEKWAKILVNLGKRRREF